MWREEIKKLGEQVNAPRRGKRAKIGASKKTADLIYLASYVLLIWMFLLQFFYKYVQIM